MEPLIDWFRGSRSDLTYIHRRVVRIGVLVAWAVSPTLLVVGLVSGDTRVAVSAVGPALAGALMFAQAMLNREHAGVAMFGSAAILAATYWMIGVSTGGLPLSLALVVVTALATAMVERRRFLAAVLSSVFLLGLPQTWELGTLAAFQVGVANLSAYLITATVLVAIRNSAARVSERYRALFMESPAAVLEEDWTDAVAYLRDEYDGKPGRVEQFLLAYPSVLRSAVDRARVLRANPAAVALLEAGSEEALVGNRDGSRVSDINLEAWAAILGALYRNETVFGIDMATVTRKGHAIWLQVRGADTDPDRPASSILVGLADVTQNRERSDAMAELVRAKNDFIAKVSHELRTPLTAVVGLASELAVSDDLVEDDREELTRLVAAQATEVANIVEDLLVAARTELGSMSVETKAVDLEFELVSTIEGLGLEVDSMPDPIPRVLADPGRVRQILRNLLTNAGRYGGPHLRVLAGKGGGRVWLEVRDDGSGVPEALAETIFEPYQGGGSRSGESVGIGLSVARQLAELMGGTLGYQREGLETVFRLVLPAAPTTPERALASQAVDA
jgi:signal transduction histidine kinase